jgi:hypothetical protein
VVSVQRAMQRCTAEFSSSLYQKWFTFKEYDDFTTYGEVGLSVGSLKAKLDPVSEGCIRFVKLLPYLLGSRISPVR